MTSATLVSHDDVIKWLHFPRYWPFVRGIHRSSANSPHRGQWRGALMFFFVCARLNGWVNNGEAGDLRRHRAHYDATVMLRNQVDRVRSGCSSDLIQAALSSQCSQMINIKTSIFFGINSAWQGSNGIPCTWWLEEETSGMEKIVMSLPQNSQKFLLPSLGRLPSNEICRSLSQHGGVVFIFLLGTCSVSSNNAALFWWRPDTSFIFGGVRSFV